MSEQARHTPVPWCAVGSTFTRDCEGMASVTALGRTYASPTAHYQITPEERDANAEFIVRACNAHDELVAALRVIASCGCQNYGPGSQATCLTVAASLGHDLGDECAPCIAARALAKAEAADE